MQASPNFKREQNPLRFHWKGSGNKSTLRDECVVSLKLKPSATASAPPWAADSGPRGRRSCQTMISVNSSWKRNHTLVFLPAPSFSLELQMQLLSFLWHRRAGLLNLSSVDLQAVCGKNLGGLWTWMGKLFDPFPLISNRNLAFPQIGNVGSKP